MQFKFKFIKLMKAERKKNTRHAWIIDESKCLSIDEIHSLRNFCAFEKDNGLNKKKFTPIRNWFMIELGLNAGLRVEEMANLQHQNLIINGTKSSIVLIGKGKKKRSVTINSEFKNSCFSYIEYKKHFGYDCFKDSYLLNNLKGTNMSKRALQKFFKIIINKSGLSSHYYIHCLRHTYTTFLLHASNHNYRFAQQQLGHASIKTTQVYASVIDTEGKIAIERLYK